MHDYRALTNPIDEQKVGSKVAFGEASPVVATHTEAMLTEGRWENVSGDECIEDVLERFGVKFGMLTSFPVIALETPEND